jgi:hypothetical protein
MNVHRMYVSFVELSPFCRFEQFSILGKCSVQFETFLSMLLACRPWTSVTFAIFGDFFSKQHSYHLVILSRNKSTSNAQRRLIFFAEIFGENFLWSLITLHIFPPKFSTNFFRQNFRRKFLAVIAMKFSAKISRSHSNEIFVIFSHKQTLKKDWRFFFQNLNSHSLDSKNLSQ